jgi:anaerobic selenocysteine-containing dehydrogenase
MNVSTKTQILPSVCPLDCPDTCSLNVAVTAGKISGIKGSEANPFTAGVVCNKVMRSYPEFVHGEGRLTHPLKRVGPRDSGQYERISWAGALDLIHAGFSRAMEVYGPQSVMPFNYAGPHGELAAASMDRRFFHRLGATQLNRGPLCGAVRGRAYSSLFGGAPGMPPEQAEHSDLILIWGNNVTVSNLHLMRVIKRARANGALLVVIDPKRTKVAEQCDLFVQIRPGTDVVLALALAAELDRRHALDHAFIAQWVEGFEPYISAARQYAVADVEHICGVLADQFHELADLYVNRRTVAASFGNGIERGHSGGSGLRAAMSLQALTGNHGRLGAGVLAKPGLAAPKTQHRLQRSDLVPAGTRVFNIVDVAAKLLNKNMKIPVKAMMIYNHNPVATHPDQARLIQGLMRDDLFIAGCDVVMTDSMKFADVILPAASHFEIDDIYGAYGQNYVQRAAPVIPCVGEALPNTEIFRRLAARFGFDDAMFGDSDAELMDQAMNGADARFNGVRPSRIALDQAIEMRAPRGEDLILCKTVKPGTKSGRIELYSQALQDQYGYGLPRYEPVVQDLPLVLITPSSSKRTNATFGGCAGSLGAEVVEMHPEDAEKRGLSNGDKVVAWNARGRVTFKLVVTDATRPGVLYSPKGTWRQSSETGLTANALIPSDIRTDIEDGACYNETFVEVGML